MKAPRKDELLLAIALQETNARGLAPGMGEFFVNAKGDTVGIDDPTLACCCAVGALVLGGVCSIEDGDDDVDRVVGLPRGFDAETIAAGNDDVNKSWDDDDDDLGETLGHAFQLATGGYGAPWYRG
jgi:hypothetical protein